MGLGLLLADGIGDTIRVSLSAEPEEEIPVAYEILRSLELRNRGVTFVSCPSCGRVEIDVISVANEVEKRLSKVQTPIHVAVMGCVVNGPGESRDADVGLAGGKGSGVIFRKGKVIKTVPEDQFLDAVLKRGSQPAPTQRGEAGLSRRRYPGDSRYPPHPRRGFRIGCLESVRLYATKERVAQRPALLLRKNGRYRTRICDLYDVNVAL